MTAFWIDGEAQARRSERVPLGGGHDEAWLQDLLLARPDLIPLDPLEPGARAMIPLRRELPLPEPGGTMFLDLLGVTRHGRPVLVERRFWRNPQARREVVAQIVEHAALMRRWSRADLLARLGRSFGRGPNPLLELVREAGGTMPEADIVGGMREDLAAIADHLGAQGGRLAPAEVQPWPDGSGRTPVMPQVPLRTQVPRQRPILVAAGASVRPMDGAAQLAWDAWRLVSVLRPRLAAPAAEP